MQSARPDSAISKSCKATIEQGGLVLVDFWAQWCGPCRSLEPVLAELAVGRPDLTVLKVDIERNSVVADEFAVRSVPTLLLFAGGDSRGPAYRQGLVRGDRPDGRPDNSIAASRTKRWRNTGRYRVILIEPTAASSPRVQSLPRALAAARSRPGALRNRFPLGEVIRLGSCATSRLI